MMESKILTRKLGRAGNSRCLIIPAFWIKQHKEDFCEIYINENGDLVIKAGAGKNE